MNSNVSAPVFLNYLRENTSELHTALEELPLSRQIISPDVSVNDYALYLSLMYNVVKDAEITVYPLLKDIITDLDNRYKSGNISKDLKDIQYSKDNSRQKRPLSENLTDINEGFALGMIYVIEGSTLGGRVIVKNVQAALGFDEHNGARYFSGYGQKTGSTWKKFLEMMIAYQEECQCDEQIIAGANYAFHAIAKHLKENSPK